MIQHPAKAFSITTDYEAMDMLAVHDFLANHAYWSPGVAFDTICTAWRNSLAFGLLNADGEQVGGARMVTDRATYGYLADVYLLDAYRGQGLGLWMVQTVMAHPELQSVRRFLLATSDMHALYEKCGFTALSSPGKLMEKLSRDAFKL